MSQHFHPRRILRRLVEFFRGGRLDPLPILHTLRKYDKGKFRADGKAALAWNEAVWTTPTDRNAYTEPPRTLQRSFLHAVTTGDPSGLRQSYGDALKTHRLVLAANESAISGQVVQL